MKLMRNLAALTEFHTRHVVPVWPQLVPWC
eukprot:COSAG05_NODE_22769_length_262_cov_0.950920_2_plen_29_part_01